MNLQKRFGTDIKKSELSIFKRYQNELSNMGITLIYNDDLFESIAEKSLVLDTGARELSNTVNYMFENIVFDVLSNPNKYKNVFWIQRLLRIIQSIHCHDNNKVVLWNYSIRQFCFLMNGNS